MLTNLTDAEAYRKKGMTVSPVDGTSWKADPTCLIRLSTSPLKEGDLLTTLHEGNCTISADSSTFLIIKMPVRRPYNVYMWEQRNHVELNSCCEARDGEYSLLVFLISHPLPHWQRRNSDDIEIFYGGDQIILPSATTGSYRWLEGKEPTIGNLISADRLPRHGVGQQSVAIMFVNDNFNLITNEGSEVNAEPNCTKN